MKTVTLLVVVALPYAWLCGPSADGAELLRKISWTKLQQSGAALPGEVLPAEPPEQGSILKITNPADEPKQVTLIELKNPGITGPAYAIRGRIRYENVHGKSYLEMRNYFPDGGTVFSRTLGETGPMKHLQGTSGWRDFTLPFSITQDETVRPDRLVVNLVLEGRGTVLLGPFALEQYDSIRAATRVPGAWWGEQTGGIVGGLIGGVLGCLGGLVGTLAGRGRARALVMTIMAVVVPLGVGAFAAGIAALAIGQPYEVWFPLVLGGGLSAVIFGSLRPMIRRRYEQHELDRISAVDLGRASP